MKKLELSAYGVEEMESQEMKQTDGGGLLLVIILVIALLCGSASEAR